MHTIQTKKTLIAGLASFACLGLVLTACSSSKGTSSDSTAPTTDASSSSAPSSSGGATTPANSGLDAINKIVEQYSADPTSIGVTTKLSKVPPTGLTIVNAIPGVPVGAVMAGGIRSAAAAFGWKVVEVDMGGTPQTITAAWNQIANMNPVPAAVIEEGIDTTLFTSQLKTLTDHKVPVIAVSVPKYKVVTGDSAGVIANIQDPSFQDLNGKVTADYVIGKSNGKANNLFVWPPDFNFYDPFVAAYKKEFATCAPDCKTDTLEIKVTDIGTNAPATIVNYLRAHPDVNAVTGAFGDVLIGLPTALKQAGLDTKVTLTSTGGGSTTLQYIKDGQQDMTLGIPLLFLGWSAMDIVARHIVGDPLNGPDYTLPIQYLTKAQLTFDITKDQWPGVADYQSKFKAIWGV